jgi:hypothetical protein
MRRLAPSPSIRFGPDRYPPRPDTGWQADSVRALTKTRTRGALRTAGRVHPVSGVVEAVVQKNLDRVRKLRVAVRYLVTNESLERGHQSRLAEHFDVSRQRVHQVVNQERHRRTQLLARVRRLALQSEPPATSRALEVEQRASSDLSALL